MASSVREWLAALELEHLTTVFEKAQVGLRDLSLLDEDDLRELGLALGPRKRVLNAIAAMKSTDGVDSGGRASNDYADTGVERRQLTVMFCDLVGSTELSRRLDPEDLREVMRAYQDVCASSIARYDGYLAQYLGDGVLAYFGYPHAHEDAAERAVRTARDIVHAIGRLTPVGGHRLSVRVGIATGMVVVGAVADGASELSAIGDTPNLAARLQALAEPNTVVIADSTRALTRGAFRYVDLGDRKLKGFSEPARVWQVAGEIAASRFEATYVAGRSRFVGREPEVALLTGRWEQALGGEGQAVLLCGEGGIGKSRIAEQLRQRLEGFDHTRVRYQCSPFHVSSALQPVISQLEYAADLNAEDDGSIRLAKLESLLAPTTRNMEEVAPLLATLLGIPLGSRYVMPNVSPDVLKRRTLEALAGQLVALSQIKPVYWLVEDAHWIDPTTRELIGLCLDRVRDLPVFALITFRPEFVPTWAHMPHVTGLTLNRLARRECTELIDSLCAGKPLPTEVLEQIAAKTDGIPLFIEELTKTVLESGLLIERDGSYSLSGPLTPMAIPSTLQDSLMERLERLSPVKEVAQIGSAIGREFSYNLLAAVSELRDNELKEALGQLANAELVYVRGEPPEATYAFKHALVQDAAYSTLLRTRRQQLHARIAEVLEGRVAGKAEALPEIIAHHCTEAGLTERAVKYWWQAAQLAIQRSATLESISHLQKALKLLQALPDNPEHVRLELEMQVATGTACMAAKGWSSPVTVAAFARADELCERVDDPMQRSIIEYGRYLVCLLRGQTDAALATSTAMIGRAERKEDSVAKMIAHRCVGIVLVHRGEFDLGRMHMAEALTLYDPKEHADLAYRFSYEPRVANLSYLAHSLLPLGYPDQAQQAFDQLMGEIRTQRHNPSIAFGLFQACLFCTFERDAGAYKCDGRIGVHESIVDELIAVSTEHGFFLWRTAGIIIKGWLMARAGEADRGLTQLREGIAAWRGDAKAMVTHWLLLLANALGSLGQPRASLDAIEEALALIPETNERWKEAALYLCKGELLLALSARDHAETCLQRALAVARNQRAKLWELRAALALARLWIEKDERRKALEVLASVYGWFSEGFETPDLQDAKNLLDELARTEPSSPGTC